MHICPLAAGYELIEAGHVHTEQLGRPVARNPVGVDVMAVGPPAVLVIASRSTSAREMA